jgi:hypothetical protein
MKGGMVRAMDCECGQHLEATNEDALFQQAREHVDRDHPEMKLDDTQVREIVAQGAYDK